MCALQASVSSPQAKAAAGQLVRNLTSFALTLESDSVSVATVAVPPPVTPDLPEPLTGAPSGASSGEAEALKGQQPGLEISADALANGAGGD